MKSLEVAITFLIGVLLAACADLGLTPTYGDENSVAVRLEGLDCNTITECPHMMRLASEHCAKFGKRAEFFGYRPGIIVWVPSRGHHQFVCKAKE